MDFKGVLGHEFVGVVTECDNLSLIGQRVVGEINAGCGQCDWCRRGLERHCPNRLVLGISKLDGCFADFCTLPMANLYAVPDAISDTRAVFVEPVSAAFEIFEQMTINESDRCIVLGDGKMGILCAWALATASTDVTLIGHHPHKLAAAQWRGIRTETSIENVEPGADVVVEATGRANGIAEALKLCKPRGTLVLKSTTADDAPLNLAPLVVNEVTMIGSRCGRFKLGLHALMTYDFPLEHLIKGRYPLDEAEAAIAHATRPEALKMLIDV
jgi:alcohol dehydrogenase